MTPMSLYYKYVAVRQEGFLSSSLSIHPLFKALVGEHRALSGMAMILTPLCSPDILFFFNMRSYMNLAVLALAASIISPARSAPIQYRHGDLLIEFKGSSDKTPSLSAAIPPSPTGLSRPGSFPRNTT